jgi:hypothetical protein
MSLVNKNVFLFKQCHYFFKLRNKLLCTFTRLACECVLCEKQTSLIAIGFRLDLTWLHLVDILCELVTKYLTRLDI